MAACASSGCIAIAIGKTSHEELNRSTIDTRATNHQADVSGQRCYTETKTHVVSKVHMHREYAAFGLLEALVGTLPAFDDNATQTMRYAGYAVIADGLLAAFWTYIHDGSVSTDDDWAMTTETGSCAH